MCDRSGEPNYLSVLFPNLLQPITDLFRLMGSPEGPNEVQASKSENGYASAISLLGAVVIESVCNRARYISKDIDRKGAVETLRSLAGHELAADIEEIFVLRDVIAHNHLWEAEIADDETRGLALTSARRRQGYGDEKFSRVVDQVSRRTKRLKLDIFPNRIHRGTALQVIRKVAEVFRSLREKDATLVGGADPLVIWANKPLPFCMWVDRMTSQPALAADGSAHGR
jgi:hypothetical protein